MIVSECYGNVGVSGVPVVINVYLQALLIRIENPREGRKVTGAVRARAEFAHTKIF